MFLTLAKSFSFSSSLNIAIHRLVSRKNLYTSQDLVGIQKKWQGVSITYDIDETKGKKYILSMFPYPSGALHMGHVRVYTISDTLARYHKLLGHQVMHPMGWDAFGLPAENAAIERGIFPKEWTEKNIKQMHNQLDSLCLSFNWECEVTTCDPQYYRWTQWIFLKLFKKGLAYRKEGLVNWDPIDETVLADEQVDINGRSWRSGAIVEKRALTQWYLKITAMQDELLEGLKSLNWPESVKEMQKNWILSPPSVVEGEQQLDTTPNQQYRLRDWLISRQRYWGAPIPIIHCSSCGTVPVPEDQLPVELPKNVNFTGKGGSPLLQDADWINTTCPECKRTDAKREADTMDTFMDSSWYYLRHCDSQNTNSIADPIKLKTLLPVDVYIGGIEHAIMHLLYARFINRFLVKNVLFEEHIEEIDCHKEYIEPFKTLITQGLVEGITFKCPTTKRYLKPEEVEVSSDGQTAIIKTSGEHAISFWEKMSKSKYNGVDPVELVERYGADVLRLCILFKAPPEIGLKWNTRDIPGPQRWLVRLLNLTGRIIKEGIIEQAEIDRTAKNSLLRYFKKTVKDMETAYDPKEHKLNLAVSNLMKLTNVVEKSIKLVDRETLLTTLKHLAIMLHPMAPNTSMEILNDIASSKMLPSTPSSSPSWPFSNDLTIMPRSIEDC